MKKVLMAWAEWADAKISFCLDTKLYSALPGTEMLNGGRQNVCALCPKFFP